VLAEGRVIYQGEKLVKVIKYFSTLDLNVLQYSNLRYIFIAILNTEITDESITTVDGKTESNKIE
jgi:hypothetical protein